MSLVNQSLTINFTIPKTEAKLIIFFVFNQHRNSEFSLHFTYCVNLCKTLTSNQSFYPDFTGVKLVACQQCNLHASTYTGVSSKPGPNTLQGVHFLAQRIRVSQTPENRMQSESIGSFLSLSLLTKMFSWQNSWLCYLLLCFL